MSEKEIRDAVNEVFEGLDFNSMALEVPCPEPSCPVHHRVDRETLDEGQEFGSAITYVGEYAVVTGDNLKLTTEDAARMVIAALLGTGMPENLPLYEVCVYEVGEATLVEALGGGGSKRLVRHFHTFDKWEDFLVEHRSMVQQVKDGTIDLSGTPDLDN